MSHVIPEKGAVGVSPDLTPIFPDHLDRSRGRVLSFFTHKGITPRFGQ